MWISLLLTSRPYTDSTHTHLSFIFVRFFYLERTAHFRTPNVNWSREQKNECRGPGKSEEACRRSCLCRHQSGSCRPRTATTPTGKDMFSVNKIRTASLKEGFGVGGGGGGQLTIARQYDQRLAKKTVKFMNNYGEVRSTGE